MSDDLNKKIEHITEMQVSNHVKLSHMSNCLDQYRDDLKSHMEHTEQKFTSMDTELKDIRMEHVVMVGEVRQAVLGLRHIADEVKRFYSEFKDDRNEQMSMIKANNTFRDRLLGGVGAVTLAGTIITVVLNYPAIKAILLS